MAFRIKDLMINVIPQQGEEGDLGDRSFAGDCGHACNVVGASRFFLGCEDDGYTAYCVANSCGCSGYTPWPPPPPPQCFCLWRTFEPTLIEVQQVFYRGVPAPGAGPGGAQGLAALKEQLRQALARVEARQEAVEAASRPRTREQAEALEEKLESALHEVRGWKTTLPSGESE